MARSSGLKSMKFSIIERTHSGSFIGIGGKTEIPWNSIIIIVVIIQLEV